MLNMQNFGGQANSIMAFLKAAYGLHVTPSSPLLLSGRAFELNCLILVAQVLTM